MPFALSVAPVHPGPATVSTAPAFTDCVRESFPGSVFNIVPGFDLDEVNRENCEFACSMV